MGDKYELLDKSGISLGGKPLYQIRALKNFGDVKVNDLGGYVESEKNLSQKGNCWLYDRAKAYGKSQVKDNAKLYDEARVYDMAVIKDSAILKDKVLVYEKSQVFGNAIVKDNAEVRGSARVFDKAELSDDCVIYDNAFIKGNAKIYDNASVYEDAEVSSKAKIYGDAQILGASIILGNAQVFGTAEVRDEAQVYNKAQVYGNAEIIDNAKIYGNAKVFDDAVVAGDSKIFGNAVIKGKADLEDVSIDKGTYDGKVIKAQSDSKYKSGLIPSDEGTVVRKQIQAIQEARFDSSKVVIAIPETLESVFTAYLKKTYKATDIRFIHDNRSNLLSFSISFKIPSEKYDGTHRKYFKAIERILETNFGAGMMMSNGMSDYIKSYRSKVEELSVPDISPLTKSLYWYVYIEVDPKIYKELLPNIDSKGKVNGKVNVKAKSKYKGGLIPN